MAQRVIPFLVLIPFALLCAGARTEESDAPSAPGAPEQAAPREGGQDTRKLLEEVLMARLTKELALDETQTVLMVRHLAEYRDAMAAVRRERAQVLRSLRQAVRESKDEKSIAGLMAELATLDQKALELRTGILDVDGVPLTTWQKARLYLFINEFEADMRRLLNRAQERRAPNARTPGKGQERGRPDQTELDDAPVETAPNVDGPEVAPAPSGASNG